MKKKVKAKRVRRRIESKRDSTLAELAVRLGVRPRRLRLALEAAEHLQEPELSVLEKLVDVAQSTSRTLRVRRELAAGLGRELERFWTSEPEADPLADVDQPLAAGETAAATLWADSTARLNRSRLLAECISSSEAGELTDRSRQAVERQRKAGSLVALRSGRQWRYPKWQFDIDGPGGLLPGLGDVLENLRLSPYGATLWLTTPKAELSGQKPANLLRRRQTDRVIRLAEDHGQTL